MEFGERVGRNICFLSVITTLMEIMKGNSPIFNLSDAHISQRLELTLKS